MSYRVIYITPVSILLVWVVMQVRQLVIVWQSYEELKISWFLVFHCFQFSMYYRDKRNVYFDVVFGLPLLAGVNLVMLL